MFELEEEIEIQRYIIDITMTPSGLYFVVSAITPLAIEVFYQCPAECATCYFPNNCTTCIQGYQLQDHRCERYYTNCVRNSFFMEDICRQYCS